ncbi:MAG: 3-hydroxylacyl-ACP dehydratase [Stenotrophobium sp.]
METSLRPGFSYTPEQVLPHRYEALLVDAVSYGADYGRASLTVREKSPYCDGIHGIPAWVGVEYMAQALGVFSGVELLQAGQAVKIGLLIGTRRYESSVPAFALGTHLTITAKLLSREDRDIYVFACEISDGQRVLARGDIKAFRPDDVHAYLGF